MVDSEPIWEEAAIEFFAAYGFRLSHEEYITTTGLRSREFVETWFHYFGIAGQDILYAEQQLLRLVIDKVKVHCVPMPGVEHIFRLFSQSGFRIGIASSSPMELINIVCEQLGLNPYLQAKASAEKLPYGKPHPQVYLDCAEALGVHPVQCLCFEDSFNGMIAAKAARMKCVVVPHHTQAKEERWAAADFKLSSLANFGTLHLGMIDK